MAIQAKELHKQQQRGFTAIELIIVLIVGFSIIALSASKLGDLFSKSTEASAIVSLTDLGTNLRGLRKGNSYGTDGTNLTDVVTGSKLYGSSMNVNSAGNLINEWNGEVTMHVADNGNSVRIDYPDVPKRSCAKIVKETLGTKIFGRISVGAAKLNFDSTPNNILTACNVDNENTLISFFVMDPAAAQATQ